ncbi:MAG: asparagine synthase (glutamine-hydrolysing) [bacterium]|nr:MAG: asparagine synthase (glutamine-hydrolysing) [bacterium]KAF0149813.1 MAG: asparagine synthase (glutamine-hydrolysing) [bacterium]KAF0168514.1 MAG: asparagine synthase (glutamine-hydrolysing) [bacterium]TXT19552.1 MAG: asparagine synthase (glutamine-hydrolysing) [bacterium]
MCGINGIFAYAKVAPEVDREELLRTRDAMRARGPDHAGAWHSPAAHIGLGHRRLSIIDLSELGSQPMSTSDGRYTISFNGEIYNYAELREELAREGARFRSHSDTEVLLHLYRRDGPEMVRALRGMFAFALWDEEARSLFLARDPHGIKPLYYADDGKTFRFASQVQALLAGGALPRRVSPGGLVGFLMWGSVPEPLTFYQGIRELPAGHAMHVTHRGAHAPTAYWRLGEALVRSAEAARLIPRGEEIDVLRETLASSVRAHLVADVPVGAFLSAGLDSTVLVGLAHELGHDIQTYTVTADDFLNHASDEAPAAAEFARHIGVPHAVARISLEHAHETIPKFLAAMDQPTVDGINTWMVTEATRRAGLKVVISGLGGDELLGGYSTFGAIAAIQANSPQWMRKAGVGQTYSNLYAWCARVLKTLQPRNSERWLASGNVQSAYLWQRGLFMPWELSCLLPRDICLAGFSELSTAATWEAMPNQLTPWGQVSLLESTRYMRNQLLRDSDWVGMAHSLELRTPLVDHRVTEQLSGLAALGRLGQGKTALGGVLAKGLPDAIRNRPKTGFTLPIWQWLHTQEDMAGWKRNAWLRSRHARNAYSRWGYAILARMPEAQGMLL